MIDPIGSEITKNTVNCYGFNFSYEANIIALRTGDNSNVLINNFPKLVNGI